MLKKYCVLLLFFYAGSILSAFSQEWSLPVEGKVYKAGKKLEGAIVTLYKNGSQITQIVTQAGGKFDFDLDPEAIYLITIAKPGHITKRFTVNTRNVPPDRAKFANFNPFRPDVTIWEMPKTQAIATKTEEILSQSLAEYAYISSEENFNFDIVYTKKMQAKLDELAGLQVKAEEEEKRKAEQAAIDAKNALALENKYNAIIQQANAFFTSKDYSSAKIKYTEALAVKPNEKLPKAKIAEIDKLIADKAKADELEKNYKAAIAAADKAFAAKEYSTARSSYSQASAIKPGENYPKNKIAEIDVLWAKQKDIDDRYKAALLNADKSFNGKLYSVAKTGYEEAGNIKPNEQYPKDRIAEITKLLAAKEKEELDKKYSDAIAKADKAFTAKDWTNAKGAYNEAATIKPAELYPKNKLAEIDKMMKGIAAKELEEKAREQKYKELISFADKAFASSDWVSAKTNYTDASALKPAEQYPKDKITAINKLLADAAKQKEMDEKYKSTIGKADNAFAVKDYSSARINYSEASAIKSTEKYPKDKITEIDALLAKDKAAKEMLAKYAAAVAKADHAFAEKNYTSAKASYAEASALKPEEKYPKDKINEINKILADASAKNDLDKKYNDAVAKADKNFTARNYEPAKASYAEASALKPSEKYPKDKITEIDKLLSDMASKNASDKKYNDAIAKADKEFADKNYDAAKASYTDALAVKPEQKYPKDKINEINTIAAELAAKTAAAKEAEEKYKAAISSGDKFYAEKKYTDAKNAYRQALAVKPAETYPKQKIAEIDKIVSDIAASNAKEQKYQEAILRGDKSFEERNLNGAKTSYETALVIKPYEKYPKDRLAEIDKLLATEALTKANDEKYKKTIADADKFFAQQLYAPAKSGYEAAIQIKPGEQYPKDRLTEVHKLLAAKEEEEKYKEVIAKGNKAFGAKDYSTAKSAFTDAAYLKPNEKYPKEKLSEINKILDAIASKDFAVKERNEKYAAAIMKADNLFGNKKYTAATSVYTEASNIKPEEKYPKERITEINTILQEQEQLAQAQQMLKKYGEAIARGDKAFGIRDYNKAEISYNEALSVKPDEKYPKDQLKKIKDARNLVPVKKDTVVISDNNLEEERRKAYMNELVNKYPQGITELPETMESGRKILTRVVVKRDQAWVYKRITHSYGAIFWYKDDKPITEAIFETETH